MLWINAVNNPRFCPHCGERLNERGERRGEYNSSSGGWGVAFIVAVFVILVRLVNG